VQKALDALLKAWFKAEGSVEEAVEVLTAAVKGLRRKYADRHPWAHAFVVEGEYLIGLGKCLYGPQLQFSRSECDRLRRTLKRALRRKDGAAASHPHGGLWMSVNLHTGVLQFSALRFGVDTVFRLNRRRCRELIGVLTPANLDRLEREYEEEMSELQEELTS
jgi:hypothetical protein